MINLTTLATGTLALLAGALGTGAALAAPAGATPVDPAATASCIMHQLPQGARMFRASDGSLRVQASGRRGNTAVWTITATPDAVRVVRDGGKAGLERTIASTCY